MKISLRFEEKVLFRCEKILNQVYRTKEGWVSPKKKSYQKRGIFFPSACLNFIKVKWCEEEKSI
jgi:hypothetical protein